MSKYAIIKAGSKQYHVKAGDIIDVELQSSEEKTLKFQDVLVFSDNGKIRLGSPLVKGASVLAEIVGEVRGPKVFAYKYKRRKRSTRKKVGHRQNYLRVKITDLTI